MTPSSRAPGLGCPPGLHLLGLLEPPRVSCLSVSIRVNPFILHHSLCVYPLLFETQSLCIAQADLKLASATQVLELQVYSTTPHFRISFHGSEDPLGGPLLYASISLLPVHPSPLPHLSPV